jgi:hypothetical protein
MHNPEIKKTRACQHDAVWEYWHENDKCSDGDCAVAECRNCGMFATDCDYEDRYLLGFRMWRRRQMLSDAWFMWFCITVAWFVYTFVWFAANQTPPYNFETFLRVWGILVLCYLAHSGYAIYHTRRNNWRKK